MGAGESGREGYEGDGEGSRAGFEGEAVGGGLRTVLEGCGGYERDVYSRSALQTKTMAQRRVDQQDAET